VNVQYIGNIHFALNLKPLNQATVPSRSQVFQCLDYVVIVCDSVLIFLRYSHSSKASLFFTFLYGGWVCIVSFLNIPTISQHDLNPGLELANPGIITKFAPLYGIEES
jgi:hypothetical protein